MSAPVSVPRCPEVDGRGVRCFGSEGHGRLGIDCLFVDFGSPAPRRATPGDATQDHALAVLADLAVAVRENTAAVAALTSTLGQRANQPAMSLQENTAEIASALTAALGRPPQRAASPPPAIRAPRPADPDRAKYGPPTKEGES